MTVKPRHNRGPRDWQNTFPITKFRYIEVLFHILYCSLLRGQRLSSLNRSLYITDTSIRRTPRVGPCLSLLPLFDSLSDGHLSKTQQELIVYPEGFFSF